ncbi:hypothetical protein Ancab_039548 [Ancistrocladus abbreviatus]
MGTTTRFDFGGRKPSSQEWYGQKGGLNSSKPITSIFFTNYPADWSVSSMWRVFLRYGRAVDVFCSSKGDRRGRGFGFVRFLDVPDAQVLLKQMMNIWIGSFKLRVAMARNRTGGFSNKVGNFKTEREEQRISDKREFRTRMSFADALKKNFDPTGNKTGKSSECNSIQPLSKMVFTVSEEEIQWLKECYVGEVYAEEQIPVLQDHFRMEDYYGCTIHPMGGKLVLLSSTDPSELHDLVAMGRDWLAQWFADVRPWSCGEVGSERLVWVRWQGMPLQLWQFDSFRRIASRWGKLISLDGSTSKKKRLDIARFLVSTSCSGLIAETVKMVVNNLEFSVKVNEEISGESLYFPGEDRKPVKETQVQVRHERGMREISLNRRKAAHLESEDDVASKCPSSRDDVLIGKFASEHGAGEDKFQTQATPTMQCDGDMSESRDTWEERAGVRDGASQNSDAVAIVENERVEFVSEKDGRQSGGEQRTLTLSPPSLMEFEPKPRVEELQLEGKMKSDVQKEVESGSIKMGSGPRRTFSSGQHEMDQLNLDCHDERGFSERLSPICLTRLAASNGPEVADSEQPCLGEPSKTVTGKGINLNTYRRKKRTSNKHRTATALVMEPGVKSGDNSISDSNIHNMNRLFLEKDGLEIDHVRAEEVWAIGRALGVSYDGNEQEVLKWITNMEKRDKAEWEERKRAKEAVT